MSQDNTDKRILNDLKDLTVDSRTVFDFGK